MWITGAFHTSPSEGVEAIASLVPINLHLKKLNGRHHLRYMTIPPLHAINSLLENQSPHKYSLANFTSKQKSKLKSPIKDVSERLMEIKDEFDPFHSIFYPSLRLVDHFPNRVIFYSPESSNDKGLFVHSSKLDIAFSKTQTVFTDIAVITDGSVKATGSSTTITYVWKDNKVTNRLKAHTTNITLLEAKLMAICIGLMLILENSNAHQIIVITDVLEAEKKIISLGDQHLQKSIIPIAMKIQMFLKKNG